MSRPLPPLLVLTLGLLASASAEAAPRIEARDAGRGGVFVVVDEGARTVVGRSGAPSATLPRGVAISSVAQLGEDWLVAGTRRMPAGRELYFARGAGGAVRELPLPAGRSGRLRHDPALVVDGARLAGAAWLEGDREGAFAVLWAEWDGEAFLAPATVSPVPPTGTQLALAATQLADGRRLVVWAGYDGEDDEIWAALGDATGWSRPLRVAPDNRVPDITPAVVTTPGGALVAWSRFDGEEYRVAMARLEGSRFLAARDLGPPGSLFPSFEATAAGTALLSRDARRGEWELTTLSADGRPERRARLVAGADDRPLVRADGSGVVWELGERSAISSWD